MICSMIHQHCFDDVAGVLEIELQMDSDAIMFRDHNVMQCHSWLNVMKKEKATQLIARYGWKQVKQSFC